MFGIFGRARRNPKQVYEDFRKTVEVAVSCVTADQCDVAANFVEAYIRCYAICERDRPVLTKLCVRIFEYLRDTHEHCVNGEHHPAWNDEGAVRNYPDINSYTKDLLDIRFRRC